MILTFDRSLMHLGAHFGARLPVAVAFAAQPLLRQNWTQWNRERSTQSTDYRRHLRLLRPY